jgi:spermidine synthase
LFFLASDGELTTDIAQRLERAAVPTRLVNRGYLTATFSADRLADVARAASQTAQANTDFSPALYYYYLRQWISRFNLSFGLAEGLALLALAAYLLRIGVVPFAIFTTGLAGSALEVVILLAFQVLYGSVYHKVGMIMTMFMVGLAGGALAAERAMARWGRRDLLRLEIAMAACGAAAPLVLMGLGRLEAGAWANVTFGVLAAIPGALVGMEFPLAGKVIFKGTTATAAQLYAADLIGACLGAILVSTLLIPLIGVAGVCILTAGLKVASGSALLLSRGS